ncbi:MAG TPA: hypothetical protein ENJ91_05705 [Rhodobacteraceae bacterium]|nr:hypothetical protein [Paracoccaceae bacterium]
MILRFDLFSYAGKKAGISILEALVVLAILAMVLGLSAGALRGPSPALQLQKQAGILIEKAANLRQRAIREGKKLTMENQTTTCDTTIKQPLSFFPDGTASGPDLCLVIADQRLRLHLNALTGRLLQVLE